MRKTSGQPVDIAGQLLGKVFNLCTPLLQNIRRGDKPRGLSSGMLQVVRGLIHGKKAVFVSVTQQFLPTIHTTYKDNQNIKINLLVTSRSIV